jgi:shikimate dehydrogenase
MAKAVSAALRDAGFGEGVIVARNETTGRALASRDGFAWRPAFGDERVALLVNATPVGMAGGPEASALPAPRDVIASARVVLDVVASPPDTPLVRAARAAGATVVTGDEVSTRQAAEQFVRYTGVRPTDEQVRRAATHARS